jgi:hypothetical protein
MSGLVLAMSLALIACSDQWNDHYEVKDSASGNGTIWEVISTDPELSNFSDVIEQCGYSSLLSSMQSFTLFAPTNSKKRLLLKICFETYSITIKPKIVTTIESIKYVLPEKLICKSKAVIKII